MEHPIIIDIENRETFMEFLYDMINPEFFERKAKNPEYILFKIDCLCGETFDFVNECDIPYEDFICSKCKREVIHYNNPVGICEK
jgi:hypothetical protein